MPTIIGCCWAKTGSGEKEERRRKSPRNPAKHGLRNRFCRTEAIASAHGQRFLLMTGIKQPLKVYEIRGNRDYR
jgi:hypothetical protein